MAQFQRTTFNCLLTQTIPFSYFLSLFFLQKASPPVVQAPQPAAVPAKKEEVDEDDDEDDDDESEEDEPKAKVPEVKPVQAPPAAAQPVSTFNVWFNEIRLMHLCESSITTCSNCCGDFYFHSFICLLFTVY